MDARHLLWTTSFNNCGVYGKQWAASVPNATPSCVAGTCSYICNDGFTDCNGKEVDGCEANVQGGVLNCDACGVQCHTDIPDLSKGMMMPPQRVGPYATTDCLIAMAYVMFQELGQRSA